MRVLRIGLATAVLATAVLLPGSTTAVTGDPVTVTPVADADVRSDSPNSNTGTATTLRARTTSRAQIDNYLKFSVSGVGAVSSAKLRLYVSDGSPDGGAAHTVADSSWTETGLTWNNRPTPGSTLADIGAVSTGSWIELDVSASVTGDGTYSFAVIGAVSNVAKFHSRQGANDPQLVLTPAEGGGGDPIPPSADFTASPTSGTAPLTVSFSDTSTGSPTAWAWDFNNDGSADSTSQNPSHTYSSAGTYSVKLTVSNASGSDSESKTGHISVGSDSGGGGTPLTVTPAADTFVNSGYPSTSYGNSTALWTRNGVNDQNSYLRFTLSGVGGASSASLRLYVSDASPDAGSLYRVAANTWNEAMTWSSQPALGSRIIDLGAVSAGAWVDIDVSSYVTGDGTYSFAIIGEYNDLAKFHSREGANDPQLVVTPAGGGTVGAPVADFSATPASGSAPLAVTFNDTSSNSPTAWAWDFDNDGSIDATDQHPSFTYSSARTYPVSLTATNADGADTETKIDYINVTAPSSGGTTPFAVFPTVETDPIPHSGDAADDPAIWIHPTDPAKSLIIGTDKAVGGGLATYDLTGRLVEYRADGAMNNIDVRAGFSLGGTTVSLVAATQESDNTIATYVIDPTTRLLVDVEGRPLSLGIDGYGGCMYRSALSGKLYFFADSKSGDVEQWELFDDGSGKVDATLVRSFDVGTQVEGCVADDDLGQFYIGEEGVGIWRYSAEPSGGAQRVLVDSTGVDGHLVADVEGLTIAYGTGDSGYLLASSQGDSSYAVYQRGGSNTYVASFVINASPTIDGTSGTDGIDATVANLGSAFPSGAFVAQDGSNSGGNQNFKLVPLESILNRIAGLTE